jgi:hypothetical protein
MCAQGARLDGAAVNSNFAGDSKERRRQAQPAAQTWHPGEHDGNTRLFLWK